MCEVKRRFVVVTCLYRRRVTSTVSHFKTVSEPVLSGSSVCHGGTGRVQYSTVVYEVCGQYFYFKKQINVKPSSSIDNKQEPDFLNNNNKSS